MAAHIGHLSTTAGEGPEVVIKMVGTDVVVVTPDDRRHVWPAELVRLNGVSSPLFRIEFDGELAVFTAHHPSRFLFEFIPALLTARLEVGKSGQVTSAQTEHRDPDEHGPDHDNADNAIEQPGSIKRPSPIKFSGNHWSPPEEADDSDLLRAVALGSENQHLARANVETAQESKPDVAPQASRAPLFRRGRWLKKQAVCSHDWVPVTVEDSTEMVCAQCSKVKSDSQTDTTQPAESDRIVIDLTDSSSETGSLLDSLAARFRS